ncbi:ABC transporter substrate-binding protein [Thermodesulfobacteriota bacterium]
MKRKLFLVLISLVFLFLSTADILAAAPGVTKDSIKLGAIVDKSGPVVHTLTQCTYGQLAYIQKAYDDGIYKRKINLVTEDGSYNPAKHLAAGKLLLDRDNVFAFINSVGTSPTLALNNLLEARKVPLVSMVAATKALAVPFKKYIFNQQPSYFSQARVAVDFIQGKDPNARIAIVCQDDQFGHEARDAFLVQSKKHGITPAGVVTYQRGNRDFSSPVLKLKSLNPDYIINHGIPPYAAAVMKEAMKIGWKTKWVITATANRITLKMAGESVGFADEVYGVKPNYPPGGNSPGAIEFREAIKKYQPKAVPDYGTILGYGFAKILVEGLKRAEANNDLTRVGLIKALESLKNFGTGVFPPITYSSTSHAAPDSCLLVKHQNGAFVPLTGKWQKAK